jgi:dynein heavy chain
MWTNLEEHLITTQAMRGSPYFKPFETEVLGWESQLVCIQETIYTWLKVQSKWLYMEPMFSVEEIVRQLPRESALFKDVDTIWKSVMETVLKNAKVLQAAGQPGMLEQLKKSIGMTETIDLGINTYLEQKKVSFPRFFFLSNKEILQTLSETKDPSKVMPFIQKLFEGIEKLEFNDIQAIQAMISPSNERIQFSFPIQPREARGCVEKWLAEVENQMLVTLQQQIFASKESYNSGCKRANWILDWPGQVLLAVDHYFWTAEIQEAIKGGEHAVREQMNKQKSDIHDMIEMIKCGNVTKQLWPIILSILTQQVYFQEVTSKINENKIFSENDFVWNSQIKMITVDTDLILSMLGMNISYRYEYLGYIHRLVMTPSTHEGILSLAIAFNMNYFGSIEGPADVGKSSLAQELARYVGTMLRFMNTTERTNILSMNSFLFGVASSGCWAIIEDFDRANSNVMSFASIILNNMRNCIINNAEGLSSENGLYIPIEKGYFVMKTTNFSHLGRNEIPETLKVLFRPITLLTHDLKTIANVKLNVLGFTSNSTLSQKLQDFFSLVNQQFTKQSHYHFGLRCLERITEFIRDNTLGTHKNTEIQILVSSIEQEFRQALCPKDINVFRRLVEDTFQCDPKLLMLDSSDLESKAEQCSSIIGKCCGTIIIGPTYTGKTTILNRCATKRNVTRIVRINPKSVDANYFFGHQEGKVWHDGILSKFLQESSQHHEENWLVFDGPMDYSWAENLNSVLDDKKIAFFDSGETIHISSYTKLIFECSNLANITPATISRCGIIAVDNSCLTWVLIMNEWFSRIKQESWLEAHDVLLKELFEWMLPPLLKLLENCRNAANVTANNLVQCSLDLFEKILQEALPNLKERKYLRGWIQAGVVYSTVWSIGGCLENEDERNKFDLGIREVIFGKNLQHPLPPTLNGKFDALPPVEGVLFDFVFDFRARGQWKHWNDIIKNTDVPEIYNIDELLVPTIDSARYINILDLSLKMKKPFILIGKRGIGKSSYISNRLNFDFNKETEQSFTIKFTPSISQQDVYTEIVGNLTKLRQNLYGPRPGKKCIIFMDNFSLPIPDKHGDQPPNEFVHQLLDLKVMYDYSEYTQSTLTDTTIVSCMTVDYGMKQELSARTLRHFHAVSCTHPNDDSILKVFSTKLNIFFKTRGFQPEASGVVGPLVQSSIYVYNALKEKLLPIPQKCHYIFNLRDIAKIVTGCTLLPKELSDNKKLYTRLWVHECLRVFNDRLTTSEDTAVLFDKIKHCVRVIFRENFDSAFEHLGKVDGFVTEQNLRNLTFGDFIAVEGRKFYQEITSFDEFAKQTKLKLKSYFEENPEKCFKVDVFKYPMENISKVCRILSLQGENLFMLGDGGSGRETVAKVAAIMKNITFYTPPLCSDFTFEDWRKDLKAILKETGGFGKGFILFLTSSHLKNKQYLEDVNNILTSGQIKGLFSLDERYEITEQVHHYLKEFKDLEAELSPSQLYGKFVQRCRANLHFIIKLPLNNDTLRHLAREYPELLNSSTVCMLDQWPEDALQKASEILFEELPISRDERKSIISCMKEIYIDATKKAGNINAKTKHKIEITPSSFMTCINFFKSKYLTEMGNINANKKTFEDVLAKYEWIGTEIIEIGKEIEDLESHMQQLHQEYDNQETQNVQETTRLHDLILDLDNEEGKVKEEQYKLDCIRETCEKEFRDVNSKLSDCIDYLKACSFSDLSYPAQLKKPNSVLKKTVASICILLNIEPDMIPDPSNKKKDAELIPDYWGPGKKLLQDPEFIQKLLAIDKENIPDTQLNLLRNEYILTPDFDPSNVAKSSPVGEVLCRWVKLVETFVTIDEANQDKKAHLKEAELAFEEFKKTYFSKKTVVDDQHELLKNIGQQKQENRDKLKELIDEMNFLKIKQERGQEMIVMMLSEKEWWLLEKEKEEYNLETLVGNIMLISFIKSYLSAFPEDERNRALDNFILILEKWNLKLSDESTLFSIFVQETEKKSWEQHGLPNNKFYNLNALLLKIASRWPLLVDPEQQTINWLKNIESKNNLKAFQADDIDLCEKIVKCVETGTPILIENVKDELNSKLDNLIQKNFFSLDGCLAVEIDKEKIKLHPNFRIIFASQKDSVNFPSKFQSHFVVINCIPTLEGLEDYLKRIVLSKERKDLDQKTEYTIRQQCETTKLLEFNRSSIIKTLLNTDGNILEQESSFKEISKCCKEVENCLKKIKKIKETQAEISDIHNGYLPIAMHGATLFTTVKKMLTLNKMYTYSLEWYTNLFISSIDNSNKSKTLSKRVRYLCDHLTFNCYSQVAQSIYMKDRQTFSFVLCLDLLLFNKMISKSDVELLLADPVPCNVENPGSDWISEPVWDSICCLERVGAFVGIVEDFIKFTKTWKLFCDSIEAEDMPLHEPWNSRLEKLQKLILVKILRPDKLVEVMNIFLSNNLGYKFIEPLPSDLGRVLSDTGPKVPVLFLLSERSYPLEMVKALRRGRHNETSADIHIFSLHADCAGTLIKVVESSLKDGSWIVIQNCHLSPDCCKLLDSVVLQISKTSDVNSSFRLWLTSKPTLNISMHVINKSIKIAVEEPRDIKDQLLISLQSSCISQQSFDGSVPGKEASFSKIVYSLLFFITKCNGRNMYQSQGWSVATYFSTVDVEFIFFSVQQALKSQEGVSFHMLKFLINNCNLCHRVRDAQDRVLLKILLDDILTPNLLTVNRYKLSSSPKFFVPNKILYADYVDFVKHLPQKQSFDAYDATKVCHTVLEKKNAQHLVLSINIANNCDTKNEVQDPLEFCTETLMTITECTKKSNITSKLDWLFEEELNRYCNLISLIKLECTSLHNQMEGKMVLDPYSECLSESIREGKVPEKWSCQGDLGILDIRHFIEAVNQNLLYITNELCQWDSEKPISLSSFLDPGKFLEGCKLLYCKENGLNIGEVGMTGTFLPSAPLEGLPCDSSNVFVTGSTLEFAHYDYETEALGLCASESYRQQIPCLQITFTTQTSLHLNSMFLCPVYLTPNRRLWNGDSSLLFHLGLKAIISNSLLVKSGAAILIRS